MIELSICRNEKCKKEFYPIVDGHRHYYCSLECMKECNVAKRKKYFNVWRKKYREHYNSLVLSYAKKYQKKKLKKCKVSMICYRCGKALKKKALMCRECSDAANAYMRSWRKRNPDKVKKYKQNDKR